MGSSSQIGYGARRGNTRPLCHHPEGFSCVTSARFELVCVEDASGLSFILVHLSEKQVEFTCEVIICGGGWGGSGLSIRACSV